MSLTITNSISRLVNKLVQENAATSGNSPTAKVMQTLATAAILAGQFDANGTITTEWRAYMEFLLSEEAAAPKNPDDLNRLLPLDGTMDANRQQERAYLVGNGMCGTPTGAGVRDGGATNFLEQ